MAFAVVLAKLVLRLMTMMMEVFGIGDVFLIATIIRSLLGVLRPPNPLPSTPQRVPLTEVVRHAVKVDFALRPNSV